MSKRRLLVVDDEPSLLRLLQASLETEGYEVILASDGETALKMVDREQPDFMVLDVMMPVIDGWGVLEKIKDRPKRPRVICLTAKANRRDLVKGWMLGADEYLTKPFDLEKLFETIAEVERRSPDEQAERRSAALKELLAGD